MRALGVSYPVRGVFGGTGPVSADSGVLDTEPPCNLCSGEK